LGELAFCILIFLAISSSRYMHLNGPTGCGRFLGHVTISVSVPAASLPKLGLLKVANAYILDRSLEASSCSWNFYCQKIS